MVRDLCNLSSEHEHKNLFYYRSDQILQIALPMKTFQIRQKVLLLILELPPNTFPHVFEDADLIISRIDDAIDQ